MKLRLYKRMDEACCAEKDLVEEHVTSNAGEFKFRTRTEGKYWVVVNWNGKDRSMRVELATQEKDDGCDKQLFSLMPDDSFELRRVIEVD